MKESPRNITDTDTKVKLNQPASLHSRPEQLEASLIALTTGGGQLDVTINGHLDHRDHPQNRLSPDSEHVPCPARIAGPDP